METSMDQVTEAVSPIKLAHLVFKTRDKARMMDWYSQVLVARTVFDSAFIGFLSYDDEHHRVAVIQDATLEGPAPRAVGLHHAAFTYKTLRELLATYGRLRGLGIVHAHATNHGPTTSIYYVDPDGNRVELQIDNFDDLADASAWFDSGEFAENPIGVDFDPEEHLARLARGEDEALIKKRPNIGPRGMPAR